jgi:uncharacterized protein DUF6582
MMDKTPYGPKSKVEYADPGYQDDGKARYPLDTEAHCRAAWAYINMPKNAAKYDAKQLKMIKEKIEDALEKYGVDVAGDSEDESTEMAGKYSSEQEALLAGAAPLAPPAAWFSNPGLKAPTRLTITEDGHVFGHLAQWKVCHVGIGNSCVMAPKSKTNYSTFRQGVVVCDDGTEAPIGKITLGTGHANERWGIMPSREHYDNTGWAAAVVNVGEDRHGIWVNGALTNTMTPEKVAELRASALSGDWRSVNGNLELIAALAVNNPGFPIYREQGNHAFSLMAVGVVGAEEEPDYKGEFNMDEDQESVVDGQLEDEDPELAARIARWNEIEDELEEHNQERRAALLASLDQERGELARPTSGNFTQDNEIFIQYNAKFRQLQE